MSGREGVDIKSEERNGEMSFWSHLAELRGVLVRIFVVLLVLVIVLFCCMRWIFEHIITAPCSQDFVTYRLFGFVSGDGDWLPDLGSTGFHVDLISINLSGQFMTQMSASLWLAFIIAFPIVIYLLWTFVRPGLYERERRGARRAFLWGNTMFYAGCAVGYFIVFPLALRFLSQYSLSDRIANTFTIDSYMDTFYLLTLAMGVLFELPLLAWMLGRMGILKRGFFNRSRRYAIVAILILSAIITPTSDLFTLMIVFLPVYSLWEASALLVPKGDDDKRSRDDVPTKNDEVPANRDNKATFREDEPSDR